LTILVLLMFHFLLNEIGLSFSLVVAVPNQRSTSTSSGWHL